MLYLYTEEYFFRGRLKKFIKKILGRSLRGPAFVVQSLEQGLLGLAQQFYFNTPPKENVVAGVLNGVSALSWAIEQKKQGKIEAILAGPNLVVLPHEHEGILKHRSIDAIIVPSLWVQKAYEKDAPELAGKIFIWPAGVHVPAPSALPFSSQCSFIRAFTAFWAPAETASSKKPQLA